ncbi:hypothetical protein F5Y13DRAFT_158636 [Hypoxylon sp. FL1857]|nr:hypothetical protein F5Y13DRAFT_158636 [Hypoxylon sp. FL1857]
MRNVRVLLPIVLHFGRSSGSAIPPATVPNVANPAGEPTSTETPPPILNLEERDRAGGLCGYYDGDAASAYICSSGYSCVQDHDNNAVGCVKTGSNKGLLGVVYTTCLNYDVYTDYSVGPRTGCCLNENLPYCAWNTYTGSDIEGYTIIQCGQIYNPPGLQLAWDASTSGASPTTIYVGIPIPTTGTNSHSTESTNTPTVSPTTPTPTPTESPKGLSTSDKITLGTALGLGIPATIAGIIGAWYGYKALVTKKQGGGGDYASVADNPRDDFELFKGTNQDQSTSRFSRGTS